MTDPLTPESERAKYSASYTQEAYRSKKHAVHNRWALLRGVPKGTYLDVSCGRGETVALARRIGFDARGTEFTPTLINPERGITEARLPELEGVAHADYVSCYEILEHLVPQDVLPAWRRLAALANKRLWITTNDRTQRTKLPDGRIWNLHLSRLPLRWWLTTLDALGKEFNAAPRYELWRPQKPEARNWLFELRFDHAYSADWYDWRRFDDDAKAQGYKDPNAMYHFWYNPNHPKTSPVGGYDTPTLLRNLPESDKRYETVVPGNEGAVVYGANEYPEMNQDKFVRNWNPYTAHDAARLLGLTEAELLDAIR